MLGFDEIEKMKLKGREKEIAVDAYTLGLRGGRESSEDKLVEVMTSVFIGGKPKTTLEKAAYYSFLEALLDSMESSDVLDKDSLSFFHRYLKKLNTEPLCVFDPEIDCDTGELVPNGREKLFCWDDEDNR